MIHIILVKGVKMGKLNESFVRESVKPLFYTRMRLGEFDPAEMNPYTKLDLTEVESAEHQSLAVEAAGKTFVLLKNSGQLLPLKTSYSTVSVGVLVFGCGGFYWGFLVCLCVGIFVFFWLFFVEGWGV